MYNKVFNMKSLICFFIVLALGLGTFLAINPDLRAQVYEKFFKGNVLVGGKIHVVGVGVETMRVAYSTALLISMDSPGTTLACVGLTAGVGETGAVEGYTVVDDAADIVRFSVQLPDNWLDNGLVGNMEFEFDALEILAGCTINVLFYEYGNTTAIITDTIVIANAAARGWNNLVTLSTGIGADADLDAGDVLIVTLSPATNADDFWLYGVRMKYAVGLERVLTEANR